MIVGTISERFVSAAAPKHNNHHRLRLILIARWRHPIFGTYVPIARTGRPGTTWSAPAGLPKGNSATSAGASGETTTVKPTRLGKRLRGVDAQMIREFATHTASWHTALVITIDPGEIIVG